MVVDCVRKQLSSNCDCDLCMNGTSESDYVGWNDCSFFSGSVYSTLVVNKYSY